VFQGPCELYLGPARLTGGVRVELRGFDMTTIIDIRPPVYYASDESGIEVLFTPRGIAVLNFNYRRESRQQELISRLIDFFQDGSGNPEAEK
jgi:hypothetical protein